MDIGLLNSRSPTRFPCGFGTGAGGVVISLRSFSMVVSRMDDATRVCDAVAEWGIVGMGNDGQREAGEETLIGDGNGGQMANERRERGMERAMKNESNLKQRCRNRMHGWMHLQTGKSTHAERQRQTREKRAKEGRDGRGARRDGEICGGNTRMTTRNVQCSAQGRVRWKWLHKRHGHLLERYIKTGAGG